MMCMKTLLNRISGYQNCTMNKLQSQDSSFFPTKFISNSILNFHSFLSSKKNTKVAQASPSCGPIKTSNSVSFSTRVPLSSSVKSTAPGLTTNCISSSSNFKSVIWFQRLISWVKNTKKILRKRSSTAPLLTLVKRFRLSKCGQIKARSTTLSSSKVIKKSTCVITFREICIRI